MGLSPRIAARRAALALLAVSLTVPASASDYWCRTNIIWIGQMDGDSVWFQTDAANGNVWAYVCSLGASATSPSQAGCQGWLANLMVAKAQNKYIDIHFVGTSAATSCATKSSFSTLDKPVWIAFP